jgi:hypothetical protein
VAVPATATPCSTRARRSAGTAPSARRADHELGAAAADVDHERRGVARSCRGRAQEGELGLLVTADGSRVDVEALAQRPEQVAGVGAVAHGARGHRDGVGAVRVDQLAVAGDRVEHALDRRRREPPAAVDALAEAGDGRAPLELADAPAVDLRDEQPGRVRAEVDDCDRAGHWARILGAFAPLDGVAAQGYIYRSQATRGGAVR